MNGITTLTFESASALHEERVARLQRSWGPLWRGRRPWRTRRAARTGSRYDLAA